MRKNVVGPLPRMVLLFCCMALVAGGQDQGGSTDFRDLIRQGNEALEQNQLHSAAQAFQKAVDVNPSSARAHEGLGIALSKEIIAGITSPSEDSDAVDRAEVHLRRATELSPSPARPLVQFAELEAALAERSTNRAERSDRYATAQDLLKRAVALEPGRADLYLQLASLERDQFSPALQKARAQSNKTNGPISDVDYRRELKQQYGSLIDDAISNVRSASEMDSHLTKSFLLMARLLRERALIRETQQDYSVDMHSADDWLRQFLAAGGHLDQSELNSK